MKNVFTPRTPNYVDVDYDEVLFDDFEKLLNTLEFLQRHYTSSYFKQFSKSDNMLMLECIDGSYWL